MESPNPKLAPEKAPNNHDPMHLLQYSFDLYCCSTRVDSITLEYSAMTTSAMIRGS